MSRFHSIRDYRAMVKALIASHPMDEAMSIAVGGQYEEAGQRELTLLKQFGLTVHTRLVDVGCGSGRLASAIFGDYFDSVQYDGTDVVPELLDYARTKARSPNFRFHLVEDLVIPLNDSVADMVCFWSVFTHLLPQECYRLLLEAKRVLVPGGKVIFTFMTLAEHWDIFMESVRQEPAHLNSFLHKYDAENLALSAGFMANLRLNSDKAFGQHLIVAEKPKSP